MRKERKEENNENEFSKSGVSGAGGLPCDAWKLRVCGGDRYDGI